MPTKEVAKKSGPMWKKYGKKRNEIQSDSHESAVDDKKLCWFLVKQHKLT